MKSLLIISIVLFGVCTGEPPVGSHDHDHQGFDQPQPFQHQHENEIEGLQTPKFSSSFYNSLSPKNTPENDQHKQKSNSVSNEYDTPRFTYKDPKPFLANFEAPDVKYGVTKNMLIDHGTQLNAPRALYESPETHRVEEESLNNHREMKGHSENMDFQGYELAQSELAMKQAHEEYSSITADSMSSHKDSLDNLTEVVAARKSVSPFKGAVKGITEAIIRPNRPLSKKITTNNPSRFGHKSSKSKSTVPKKSYKPKFVEFQGYPRGPVTSKYEQRNLQHHLEVNEPSKNYLPSGRNSYENNAGFEGDEEEQNYEFEYKVNDYQSASDFGHRESRQFGTTRGIYHVLLPDGRKQIVEYEADEQGFKPKITYEEPEIDTRDQFEGHDANANNLERQSEEQMHSNNGKHHAKPSNDKRYSQERSSY